MEYFFDPNNGHNYPFVIRNLTPIQMPSIDINEVKTARGRQSESQKRFQMVVESLGHRYKVARSIEDMEVILRESR